MLRAWSIGVWLVTGAMQTSKLPSQNPDSRECQAYERGFIFGRAAAIRAVREALDTGRDISQTLDTLSHVEFNRL